MVKVPDEYSFAPHFDDYDALTGNSDFIVVGNGDALDVYALV